ncbi:MAG TPA: BON domain-containing protein [Burkholderiales bacterium]|nr:BON domain-containing protein [Burkholderiales bacterium]
MKQKLSQYLGVMFMALALVSFVGCQSTSETRSASEVAEDAAITTKVKAALINDATVKATDVNVNTFRNEVQLTGFVSSSAQATRAVEIARGINGVKSVKNDMRVK